MICFYKEASGTLCVTYEPVYYQLLPQLTVGEMEKNNYYTHYIHRVSLIWGGSLARYQTHFEFTIHGHPDQQN